MEDDQRELQLLPTPPHTAVHYASPWPSDSTKYRSDNIQFPQDSAGAGPSLDLQLSISLRPIHPPANHHCTEEIQAAEKLAYVERVKAMTKREMELAQSEFVRARHMWERAREEVERVEKMKERATRRIDSTCLEITCQICRQKFRH